MSHRKARRKRSKLASLYVWHRYMGVCAAIFVFLLSFSGLALNHSDSLQLSERHVQSDLILNWYGVSTPDNLHSFAVGSHYLSQVGSHIYLDGHHVPGTYDQLLGAVQLGEILVVATVDEILLITPTGDMIERLNQAHGVPSRIRKIGQLQNGSLAILTTDGRYTTDASFADWSMTTDPDDVNWSIESPLPRQLLQTLTQNYRGNGLPLERLLLDIHSGRIVGPWGPYVMDAAAIFLLLLATSGIWLWVRGIVRQRKHRKKKFTRSSSKGSTTVS